MLTDTVNVFDILGSSKPGVRARPLLTPGASPKPTQVVASRQRLPRESPRWQAESDLAGIVQEGTPMPGNRSLNVTVNFTGTQANDGSYGGTATYTQTQSAPPMSGLVDINGNINLDNMPGNSTYNWAIGINFTLNAVVTDRNGNNVPCTWANNIAQACAITGPGGSAANGMVVTVPDTTHLTIADANNDLNKSKADRTYTYKLGVMLPTENNYFISLDPTIINTGAKFL